jgi:WG containing repeat
MKHLATSLSLLLLTSASFAQDILIAAKSGGKWGYLNLNETFAIQPRYDDAWPFYDGKAVVSENNTFGVIDTKGGWIVQPIKGQALGEISNKRIVCSNEQGRWGAIDLKGKNVVPFSFDAMSAYQYNMAITGTKTSNTELLSIGVIDTLGKSVISFDNIYLPLKAIATGKKIREGYVSVLVTGDYSKVLAASDMKLDGKSLYYALLDVRSKRLVNLKIPSLSQDVREGRFNMSVDGIAYSWSVPLASELVASEAKFSFLTPAIFPFSGGIAAVQKDGKWAYVDKDGSVVSETNLPVVEYLNDQPLYSGGFVILTKKNGEGIYTDLKGAQRIAMEFEELHPFVLAAAVVKSKGKYGLIQKDGTWIIQPKYEDLRY